MFFLVVGTIAIVSSILAQVVDLEEQHHQFDVSGGNGHLQRSIPHAIHGPDDASLRPPPNCSLHRRCLHIGVGVHLQ